MTFGAFFGPHNLLEVTVNEDAALLTLRVSLLTMSAFCLAGVSHRRRPEEYERRVVGFFDRTLLGR